MSGPENIPSRGVAITPNSVQVELPKPVLDKSAFDTLIRQKGYPAYIDRATQCPCSIESNGQAQPSCRNCGGTGYVFYNRIDTHAILHSMNVDTKYKEWSKELLGTASLTLYLEVNVSYMDKITLQTGHIAYSEVISLKRYSDDKWKANLFYPAIQIQSCFGYRNANEPLRQLILGEHYTLENNNRTLVLDTLLAEEIQVAENGVVNVSIRYTHRPQFHVIDIPRKTISSLARDPKTKREGDLLFPIHAIVKVAHYILNADSNDGSYLFDNSFTENGCGKKLITINNNEIVVDIYSDDDIPTIEVRNGLIIFNETSKRFQGWNGTTWIVFGPDNFWVSEEWD